MSDAPNSTDPVGGGEPLETEAPRRERALRHRRPR
jgi:hypothetical protein